MNVIHGYPGQSAHIREVICGLQDAGDDLDVYTTLVAREDCGWERATAAQLALRWPRVREYLFPVGPRTRFHRRPLWELLRIAGGRLSGRGLADRLWEIKSRDFDRWVAANVRPKADVVIGYEHSCLRTFRRAKQQGVKAIYHMLAPHFATAEAVLRIQCERFPSLMISHNLASPTEWRRNRHKELEYATADGLIAISTYAARSVTDRGVSTDRIAVVPLGAPAVDPSWLAVPRSGPLTFLFAGNLSYGKGIPQLLRVWEQSRPADARLWLAGRWAFDRPPEWANLPGVVELGNLDHQALFQKYREADVLVFPTLRDGFGMVVTEALANGLPVITTTSAGAADLIRDGENGWVIPPADESALAAVMADCAENPGRVRAMREAAMATAADRPWTTYRREFVHALHDLVTRLQ